VCTKFDIYIFTFLILPKCTVEMLDKRCDHWKEVALQENSN